LYVSINKERSVRSNFLKQFDGYGGVLRVLDFLETTMKDWKCIGAIRMKCMEQAACVIATVCYPGKDESNREIAKKNILAAVDHGGMQTMLLASDECNTGGNDTYFRTKGRERNLECTHGLQLH